MGSLSMNQNDLFEIPAPKYGSSAANKNYVDSKSVGLPLSGGTLSGDLDMAENKNSAITKRAQRMKTMWIQNKHGRR